jgi:hypothetical protein
MIPTGKPGTGNELSKESAQFEASPRFAVHANTLDAPADAGSYKD